MDYPVNLERDEDGAVRVTFPDLPEAVARGEYEADALSRAREALSVVLGAYIKNRRPIPPPSRRGGSHSVTVPALVEVKLLVYEAMRSSGVGRAELARRLKWHRPQVDRLLNVKHASKLDQVEAAAAVLGKRLTIQLGDLDAAPAAEKRAPGRRR